MGWSRVKNWPGRQNYFTIAVTRTIRPNQRERGLPLRIRDERAGGQEERHEQAEEQIPRGDPFGGLHVGDGEPFGRVVVGAERVRPLRLYAGQRRFQAAEVLGAGHHGKPFVHARQEHRPHVYGARQQGQGGGHEQLDGHRRGDRDDQSGQANPVNGVQGPFPYGRGGRQREHADAPEHGELKSEKNHRDGPVSAFCLFGSQIRSPPDSLMPRALSAFRPRMQFSSPRIGQFFRLFFTIQIDGPTDVQLFPTNRLFSVLNINDRLRRFTIGRYVMRRYNENPKQLSAHYTASAL